MTYWILQRRYLGSRFSPRILLVWYILSYGNSKLSSKAENGESVSPSKGKSRKQYGTFYFYKVMEDIKTVIQDLSNKIDMFEMKMKKTLRNSWIFSYTRT